MVTVSPASIVIVPFPFSDLSGSKFRPALVLAESSHNDWLLCQITSKAYMDATAVRITDADLSQGALNVESFVRPMKLFTANLDLIDRRVAILNADSYRAVVTVIIASLQKNLAA